MSYKSIVKAVADKLKIDFPNAHVTSNDISEGFDRPSFFIDILNPKANMISESLKKREFTLKLSYFPTDRVENSIELLTTQEELEKQFVEKTKLLIPDEGYLVTDSCELNTVKKVLHCEIEIESYHRVTSNEVDGELIEDIEINIITNK